MKKDISKEWLKASVDDLKIISRIIDMEELSHMIAFHSQQSIEKSFKALLEYQNKRVPKQHDLLKLQELIKSDLNVNNDDLLDTLNELYIDSRYPGELGLLPYGKPTIDDANKFYTFAQDVMSKVCKILNIDENEITND
ncbi:MAG: HEPN domain-containing protein [Helicobacteraceae bacterium]|nr:HEPN domain-containing protein [Helicobacteraceae bacterium]